MGLIRGTVSGFAAVARGLAGMPFAGLPAFIAGAMVGTIFADVVVAGFGNPPATGRSVGIKKGLAAAAGSAAGIPSGGVAGMIAGAFVGSLLGV
jgi:hypothetical protein